MLLQQILTEAQSTHSRILRTPQTLFKAFEVMSVTPRQYFRISLHGLGNY